MKETVEVYEQGTGKLIETYEREVPERPKSKIDILHEEIEELKQRLIALETK